MILDSLLYVNGISGTSVAQCQVAKKCFKQRGWSLKLIRRDIIFQTFRRLKGPDVFGGVVNGFIMSKEEVLTRIGLSISGKSISITHDT